MKSSDCVKLYFRFINSLGIEDVAEKYDIEENVALVTFGGKAKVLHHLTNDYTSLRDALGRFDCNIEPNK